MKVFNEEKAKKSWALRLEQQENDVNLSGVDSKTGEFICLFIVFRETGSAVFQPGALHALEQAGYNPFEHGNKFETGSGKIIVE